MHIYFRTLNALVSCLALIMVASVAGAAEMSSHEAKLYEAAKKEGSIVWYVSQFNTEAAEGVCKKFIEHYPDVGCNPVRASAQVLLQRLTQELAAGSLQADVISTTDTAQLVQLKDMKALEAYKPENLQYMYPSLQEFNNPDGYWFTTSVAPLILAYNTNKISAADAPKKWSDLYDPKWINQTAVAHPGFSGGAGIWGVVMQDLYGKDFFEKLELNKPQITRSLGDNGNLVITGERSISVVTANRAASEALKGAAIAAIYPEDGAVLDPGSSAVLAGAPRPNSARLFAEFLLSPAVSELYVAEQRFPIHRDVPQSEVMPPLNDIKLIVVPVERAIEAVPEIRSSFRDIFGI